ncbi:DNA adenine methylase [Enterococcus diestrammenae]|uniref:DNA adenine methylase n=1 Tax=Enterococcus diestrammenae TaxID=1155073 RepID=UPI00195A514D
MPQTKSPLRYPGGKSQLWKFVNKIISENNLVNPIYCEPYAGGSGISIRLLLDNSVSRIVINDYDPAIYSFWNMILNRTEAFIDLINQTEVTLEEWHIQKKLYEKYGRDPNSLTGAFATFFLNRTNVSGIILGGPIGGQAQESKYKIDCRFNKVDLIKKIRLIANQRDRIDLFNLDAYQLVDFLKNNYPRERLFTFFDPPYYKQGSSLYLSFYNHDQHLLMRDKILEMDDYYWILTYDKAPQISEMYSSVENSFEYVLNYSANQKKKATELIFSSPITHIDSWEKIHLM